MSYSFSDKSKARLATCHPDLQRLMNEVIKYYDCTILVGHRTKEDQDEAFKMKTSTLKWPDSKHNQLLSLAVDVIPSPFLGWENKEQFIYMAGIIKGIASMMGIKIRCGIDFNQDLNFKNDKLFDGPHIELV